MKHPLVKWSPGGWAFLKLNSTRTSRRKVIKKKLLVESKRTFRDAVSAFGVFDRVPHALLVQLCERLERLEDILVRRLPLSLHDFILLCNERTEPDRIRYFFLAP